MSFLTRGGRAYIRREEELIIDKIFFTGRWAHNAKGAYIIG